MQTRSRFFRASTAVLVSVLGAFGLSAQTRLELGKMWTFENPPLAYLQEEYGFAPDQSWLDSLRMASLRFGSWCSASFVSPKGLIMTNHHCSRDNIAQSQPADQDWLTNGFYATSLEDEVRLHGLTVQQLVSMRDVTDEMLAGIDDSDDGTVAEEKRRANEQRILATAQADNPDLDPEIVTLHQGAVFQLYSYKVYSDIRLVCAPHLQSAHFGGDPDNFTYPRYCLDFSFCRAYENGAPADTSSHYFKWSATGAADGDLVFVTGNPGSTGRLLTHSQMEFLRDYEYPMTLGEISSRLRILRAVSDMDEGLARRFETIILGDENSVKAITGYLGGLLDENLMAEKARLEAEFRASVEADPELAAEYGDVWDKIAAINAEKSALAARAVFQTPNYQTHLGVAVAIVDAVNPEHPPELRAAAKHAANMPVEFSPIRRALFVDHLQRAQQFLPSDDPYLVAVLGGLDPQDATQRLASSFVEDPSFVTNLLEGGQEAVAASDDAAIEVARVLAPLMHQNQETMAELEAREAVQARRIGRALFAVYGDKISPDATMTLRFSDGIVDGYKYNGTIAPYRTTFYGMYGRNVEFGNTYPFNLPPVWLDKKDAIDMATPVNFVTTNDIIGGNSGSPVVNQNLEVVGLIFDGNIEQLPNRFLFRDEVERSVSVHVRAIIEAMSKILGADRVVRELRGE